MRMTPLLLIILEIIYRTSAKKHLGAPKPNSNHSRFGRHLSHDPYKEYANLSRREMLMNFCRINFFNPNKAYNNTTYSIKFAFNRHAPRKSPREVIKKLLISYNDQEPPMKDRPTEVQLGIYANSFYSVSEQTMDYSVSMYLRQAWRDPRLIFPPIHKSKLKVRLGEADLSHIWIPDTFFRNEKGANFHEVTVNNQLMTLNATGHIWYVTKISATLSCPMRLQKYPLDIQRCPMMFESFGYTMDTLYFSWLDSPVDIDKGLQLPQFTMQGYKQKDCSQNYTAGAFPCQEIRFILRRDVGYFLIQVYVPSMLIVILSWVSFWINVDASPARVSIGLLTVLTTATQSSQSTAALPRVSYVKAIDVWMSVCQIFVFAGLLEYAVVNVMARRRGTRIINPSGSKRTRIVHRLDLEDHIDQNTGCVTQREAPMLQGTTKVVDTADGKARARRVDGFSRKCFPLAFVLFNFVYWLAYAIPTDPPDSED